MPHFIVNPFEPEGQVGYDDTDFDFVKILDGGVAASTFGKLYEIVYSAIIKGGAAADIAYLPSQIVIGGGA